MALITILPELENIDIELWKSVTMSDMSHFLLFCLDGQVFFLMDRACQQNVIQADSDPVICWSL